MQNVVGPCLRPHARPPAGLTKPPLQGDRPLIPALTCLAVLAGGATFVWYDSLSGEDKSKTSRLAAHYAASMFGKAVDQLSADELAAVYNRVKVYFVN